LGVVKVTINGAAFTDLREVLGADRRRLVHWPETGFEEKGLRLAQSFTSCNADRQLASQQSVDQ